VVVVVTAVEAEAIVALKIGLTLASIV